MNRLATPATVSRPFLRRRSQFTASVRCARVMPTYISRRSSCKRSAMFSSLSLPFLSSSLNGNKPSLTPASTTCGHSSPLAACSVDSVTTFWSPSRSLMVDSSAIVCTTSSMVLVSLAVVAPATSSIWPPQRCAIQSQKSITLVQRAAATFSLSSPSYKCFS